MTAPVVPDASADVAPDDSAAPDGGDYTAQLANLSTLSDDDLNALQAEVTSAFEDADNADDLDAMAQAADALDQINTELGSRGNADANGTDPDSDGDIDTLDGGAGDTDGDAGIVVASAEGAVLDAPPVEPAAVEPAEPTETPPAVKAVAETPESPGDDPVIPDQAEAISAEAATPDTETNLEDPVEIPEDRKPVAVVTEPNVILAGADIPGFTAGTQYDDSDQVSQAFAARLNTIRNSVGGDGDQLIVASVQSSIPSERTLSLKDAETNTAKIDAVISPKAIVASGGYCAPLEVRYDIFGVGVSDRPVKGALPGFQAERGGIRFIQPPKLGDYTNAIGLWTAANDANPTNPTTKPCLAVTCRNELTATVDAVTLCLQFGNLMSRAFPELIARHNELAMIQQARFAEQTLLTKIDALSTPVSSAFKLGTARDFLFTMSKAAAAYRNRHRLNEDAPLRALVPAYVKDAMREDLAAGYPGDALAVADSIIEQYIAARNINVAWHLDGPFSTAVTSGGAVADFPGSFKWELFAEGTFLFLDGGTLDIGIVRDSTLVGTNDYKMFVETFESVAFVGLESLVITTNTHVAGLIAGELTVVGAA